ncbi:MAG: hypothetical protein HQK83_06740 [Fibrobacteria bacterium]|nr:hypothetical protein [Fibrobacteria bacterium]
MRSFSSTPLVCLSTVTMGLVLILFMSSCTVKPMRFSSQEPIEVMNDKRPGPVPEKTKFDFVWTGVDGLIRQPVVEGMKARAIPRAGDVNAMDDVPASTWFTPRLGYKEISPEALKRGPEQVGPPKSPVTVVKAKKGGGNPGFVIKDARGYTYLIKFDPPEFPGIETTTAVIVNRLFWGFGYNVPEDYLYTFSRTDLGIAAGGELSDSDVDSVLKMVAPPIKQVYRSTASLYISGKILGPIEPVGKRNGDINDQIDHENRRVLRGLKAFCAFTHQSGMRPDNSLDVYEGEKGKGFVRHYLLDFGEAFGGHGAGKGRQWDGYEYFISPGKLVKNFFFPFRLNTWEKISNTQWSAVGPFESVVFEPEEWKETWRYTPFDKALPEDMYWAAKIVAALTREHIRVLVEYAEYPNKLAQEYVIETIMQRRAKLITHYFQKVTPLEFEAQENGTWSFTDMCLKSGLNSTGDYRVCILNPKGNIVSEQIAYKRDGAQIAITIKDSWFVNSSYAIISITALSDKTNAPRAAQFHFAKHDDNTCQLVGVTH